MKIGVVGKGGTGKATPSALIAQAYAQRGQRVVAIDTDSNPNLAMSLGPDEQTADYGVETPAGVTLLHAMRVDQAGAGCMCAGHANVRGLLASTLEDHTDVALVDMEAGLEHLSRSGGTLAHVDVMLIVLEPTRKSLLTAARTIALAQELGVLRIRGVGNKTRPQDAAWLEAMAAEYEVPLAALIPYETAVVDADRAGSRLHASQPVAAAIEQILAFVDSGDEQRAALLAEKAHIDQRLAALCDH